MSEINVSENAVMMDIASIKPYDKNPRKNDKTVELLCKMIPKVGFNVPIVIDENRIIVKGHARYEAAKRLGMKQVPCITTHADPDTVRADRIADNKVQEFSKWNNEQLMHEIDMLDLEYDFSDMGLPRATYDDIPTFEDFYDENQKFDEKAVEEKRQRYLEFLAQQAIENEPEVQIASEKQLADAIEKQKYTPKAQRQYVKCVCKRCGNIFYIDKNVYYDKTGTVRK